MSMYQTDAELAACDNYSEGWRDGRAAANSERDINPADVDQLKVVLAALCSDVLAHVDTPSDWLQARIVAVALRAEELLKQTNVKD